MGFTKDLVSIVTPCYNSGSYVSRLLDSVLRQTYPYIEMIMIDDGSVDNTREILEQYEPLFVSRGYTFKYLYQKNQGQSVAIKEGLSYVRGEYLTWPDSDDYYSSDQAIAMMVNEFKTSAESVGMVRTQGMYVEDATELIFISEIGKNATCSEDSKKLFYDCLLALNGFYFAPIGYMVKTEYLQATLKRGMYTQKDAGQNWQLYLPILYNYTCKTILHHLHYVTIRTASHSRGGYIGYESCLRRLKVYEHTLLDTLENIKNLDQPEKQTYIDKVKNKYIKERFRLAYQFDNKKDLRNEYRRITRNKIGSKKISVMYYVGILGLSSFVGSIRKLLKRI